MTNVDFRAAAEAAHKLVHEKTALQSLLPILDDLANKQLVVGELGARIAKLRSDEAAARAAYEEVVAATQAREQQAQAAHEAAIERYSAIEARAQADADTQVARLAALNAEVAALEQTADQIRATLAHVKV